MSWLDAATTFRNPRCVSHNDPPQDRYQAWLRRTRRRLATSGGVSQAAMKLAVETGGEPRQWRERLEALLTGAEPPTIDMITRIDSLLAKPVQRAAEHPAQEMLFPDIDGNG